MLPSSASVRMCREWRHTDDAASSRRRLQQLCACANESTSAPAARADQSVARWVRRRIIPAILIHAPVLPLRGLAPAFVGKWSLVLKLILSVDAESRCSPKTAQLPRARTRRGVTVILDNKPNRSVFRTGHNRAHAERQQGRC